MRPVFIGPRPCVHVRWLNRVSLWEQVSSAASPGFVRRRDEPDRHAGRHHDDLCRESSGCSLSSQHRIRLPWPRGSIPISSTLTVLQYGWALVDPAQKIFFNLYLTLVSAAIAIIVSVVEVLGCIQSEMTHPQPTGPFWDAISAVNDNFEYGDPPPLIACGALDSCS